MAEDFFVKLEFEKYEKKKGNASFILIVTHSDGIFYGI